MIDIEKVCVFAYFDLLTIFKRGKDEELFSNSRPVFAVRLDQEYYRI